MERSETRAQHGCLLFWKARAEVGFYPWLCGTWRNIYSAESRVLVAFQGYPWVFDRHEKPRHQGSNSNTARASARAQASSTSSYTLSQFISAPLSQLNVNSRPTRPANLTFTFTFTLTFTLQLRGAIWGSLSLLPSTASNGRSRGRVDHISWQTRLHMILAWTIPIEGGRRPAPSSVEGPPGFLDVSLLRG